MKVHEAIILLCKGKPISSFLHLKAMLILLDNAGVIELREPVIYP